MVDAQKSKTSILQAQPKISEEGTTPGSSHDAYKTGSNGVKIRL